MRSPIEAPMAPHRKMKGIWMMMAARSTTTIMMTTGRMTGKEVTNIPPRPIT